MKGLLLKDFYSVRTEYKMYGFVLLFLVPLMMLLNWADESPTPGTFGFLTTYGAIAAMGLTLNSLTYDEKYGFTQYAFATTVSRKLYLAEKYVFHLINGTIGALLGMTGMLLMQLIRGNALTSEDVLSAWFIAGIFLLMTVVAGIWQIALAVRFDSVKARIYFIILVLAFSVSFASLVMMDVFTDIMILLAVLGAVFTVWMFYMSFVWMKKKEF